MPKLTTKQAEDRQAAAQINYRCAVANFGAAFAELRALDMLLSGGGYHRGFGESPPVTMLRHAVAAPDEIGSLDQDAGKIFATLQLDEG